jgi:hypothetical protein
MNSLQILSILSTDKVEELKKALIPNYYYSLLYECIDHSYISFNSKKLFNSEDTLAEFFVLVIDMNNDEIYYPSCCTFQQEKWNVDQVKEHFIETKHYTYNDIIYRIKEFEVCKILF